MVGDSLRSSKKNGLRQKGQRHEMNFSLLRYSYSQEANFAKLVSTCELARFTQ